jgi:hypothetical protein
MQENKKGLTMQDRIAQMSLQVFFYNADQRINTMEVQYG